MLCLSYIISGGLVCRSSLYEAEYGLGYLGLSNSLTSFSYDLHSSRYVGLLSIRMLDNFDNANTAIFRTARTACVYLSICQSCLFSAGGLSAVIWTDFVQVVIMVIGAVVLMAICK